MRGDGEGIGSVDVGVGARDAKDHLGRQRVLNAKIVRLDLTDGCLEGNGGKNSRLRGFETNFVELEGRKEGKKSYFMSSDEMTASKIFFSLFVGSGKSMASNVAIVSLNVTPDILRWLRF